jgi:hypothetical protein
MRIESKEILEERKASVFEDFFKNHKVTDEDQKKIMIAYDEGGADGARKAADEIERLGYSFADATAQANKAEIEFQKTQKSWVTLEQGA